MNDDILGNVNIKLVTAKFEHQGITIELIGFISRMNINVGQNEVPVEFMNLSKEIEPPGEINKSTAYDFNYKKVELPIESYEGVNVAVK